MSFLGLNEKTFVVLGAKNKKSVAWAVATALKREGAHVIHSVHHEKSRASILALDPEAEVHVCDVAEAGALFRLAQDVQSNHPRLDGLFHSIAFADYSKSTGRFHETPRQIFQEAFQISCHSLLESAHAFRSLLVDGGSIVAMSISTTTMAAANYGFMAPIKAALDASVVFLAKSLSVGPAVRVNAVCAGPLKTTASAGIPGYVDSYLFAEKATLRKRGVTAAEVADVGIFLLSPRSAGINAQRIVIDAGMGVNLFDEEIVARVARE